MARPGDAAERPQETSAVAASTRDMDSELARLSTHAAWAWLGGVRPATGTSTVRRAFCSRFGMREEDITVVQHYPEDFFITFEHQHHRDAAVARRDFTYGNIDIRVRPWQLPVHGDRINFDYHVRLCLEGIPLHAWNEGIAKRAVAKSCVLDYVESQSLRKEDTRTLNLWAWTRNPSDIPKVTWLTIVGRNISIHNVPPAGQSGLTFRVIVHLDLVEGSPGNEGQGSTRAFDWRLGVVDGESAPRDRHDPPPRRNDHHRDDDDNDHRGRRLQREDSWSTRLFRSISRAPKGRERERSGSRRDHRHYTSRRYMSGDGTGGVRQVQQPRQAAATPADASHVGTPDRGVANMGSRPHSGLALQLRDGARGRSRTRHLPRGAGRRTQSTTPPRSPARESLPLDSCCSAIQESRDDNNNEPPTPTMQAAISPHGRFRAGCVYQRRRCSNAGEQAWSDPVVGEGDLGDMAGKRMINPECAKLIPVKLVFDRLHASLSSGFPRQVGLPVLQAGGNSKLLSSTSSVTNAGSADGAPFEPAAVLQGGAPTTSQGALLSNLFVRPVAAILDSPVLPQLMPAETPAVATAAASTAQNTKHRRLFNLSADFQAWFQKPLSKEAGAALEALFNIHMPDTEHVDKALMGIAGEAIEEIQDEMDNLQAEARSNAAARLVAV